MAKASIILDTRYDTGTGYYPLKLRITNIGTNAARSFGVDVRLEDWDTQVKNVKKSDSRSSMKNEKISRELVTAMAAINELKDAKRIGHMRAVDIFSYIDGESLSSTVKNKDISFNGITHDYAKSYCKQKTAESFYYTERTVMRYLHSSVSKNIKKVLFEEIDYEFLRKFESWCRRNKMSVRTTGIHLTNIRTLWNYVCRTKIYSRDDNPFGIDGFKIKKQTRHEPEYLPMEGIRRMLMLDFSGCQGQYGLELARDAFMLSYYLCGASPVDVYHIKKPRMGVVSFVRQKIEGRDPVEVKMMLADEARYIVSKYAGKNLMLNWDEHYMDHTSFYSFVRHRLDVISAMIGYKVKWGLARHSFSTYAKRIFDGKEFIIDNMLGQAPNSVNRISYSNYDWHDGIPVMKQVIAYTLCDVAQKSVPAPKIKKVNNRYVACTNVFADRAELYEIA